MVFSAGCWQSNSTLCHLTGLKDPEHAATGPMGGAIFETAGLPESIKTISHRGQDPQVYFWRTAAGAGMDIVVAEGGRLIPLEIKLSATPRASHGPPHQGLPMGSGGPCRPGYVIHPGEVRLPRRSGVASSPTKTSKSQNVTLDSTT
jgi:uncharacterized protein